MQKTMCASGNFELIGGHFVAALAQRHRHFSVIQGDLFAE
jgi:hypothetical protein